jgi:hypothetical protein
MKSSGPIAVKVVCLFWMLFKGTKYKSDAVNSSNNILFVISHYTVAVMCLQTPGFLQRSSVLLILCFTWL